MCISGISFASLSLPHLSIYILAKHIHQLLYDHGPLANILATFLDFTHNAVWSNHLTGNT